MSAALASYNEAYQGTAHQAYHEIRARAELQVPVLSPDGAWRPLPPGAAGVRRGHRPRAGHCEGCGAGSADCAAATETRPVRSPAGHAPTAAATATTTNISTSTAAMMRFLVFGSTL